MTLGDTRIIQCIQCISKKKGASGSSSSRPVKVTVTQGKITITSIDDKFLPFTLKTTDFLKPPKAPAGKTATWISLDCVQHVHAKYQYINFQVTEVDEVPEVIETLMFAWGGSNQNNDPNSSALFADNADEMLPVHKPAPNKQAQPSIRGGRRTNQRPIIVDPEGSAAHQSFRSDFDEPKPKTSAAAAPPLARQMQELFTDYGIEGKGEVKPTAVHKSAGLSKLAQAPAAKHPPKKSAASNSYSNLAHKNDPNYRPVDSQMGLGAGISERSFYANNATSPPPSTTTRQPSSAVRRTSTKDSLDASLRQSGRVIVTPGIRDTRPKNEYHNDGDDENQNVFPTPQKSLTSASAANTFDRAFKNPNTSSSSFISKLSNSNANSQYRAPLANKNSQVNATSAYSESGTEEKKEPFPYKQQPNIDNSCYMNASLQALAVCPIFIRQLQMAVESLDKKSRLIQRLEKSMLWLNNEYSSNVPVDPEFLRSVRECLWALYGVFKEENGTGQQDSEECLTALLGAVSDECLGVEFRKRESTGHRSVGSPVKTPVKRLESDSPAGERKKPAKCDPVDLFEVKTAKMKKCSSCGNTSSTEDKDHRIRLALDHEQFDGYGKPAGPWTVKCVQQMLTRVVNREEIISDFKCEKCEQKVDLISTDQFIHFGEYIIIVLIRFKHDEYGRLVKMQSPLRVPMYMDMGEYLTDEGRRGKEEPHNETIMLDTDKSPRKESEKEKSHVPKSKVKSVTNEWIGDVDFHSPPASPEHAAGDSMECSEVKEGEEGEERMEGEMEGGDEPMKEEEEKGAKDDKKKKNDEAIEIDSSQSNDEEEGANTEGKEVRGKREEREGAGGEERRRSSTTSSVKKTTPPKRRLRMETPSTVEVSTMRKQSLPSETTPSRKRGRMSVGNHKKEGRLSTVSRGSRTSLSHSEPSRKEKRSRIEGRTSGFSKSPRDAFDFDDDEEEVIDVEEEERRRRRSSLENKPVWRTSEEKKPKTEEKDEYAFDDADNEEGMKPSKTPLKKKTGFNPPARKTLFGGSNAKTDETDHSPTKSSMEQTGGGVKRKDESTDESETKKTKTDDGMEDDVDVEGVEDEEEREKGREGNVTRRSKVRRERMSSRNSKYEDEDEEENEEDKDEDRNDAFSISDGEKSQMGLIIDEEQFGSQEGGFVKPQGEMGSSEDEVVQETPPESQGGVRDEEGERMEAGKNESNETLATTVGEEEKVEDELPVTDGEEEWKVAEDAPGHNSTIDALCLDTPDKTDAPIKNEPLKDPRLEKMMNRIFKKSKAVEDADGEVKPLSSPHMSPVKRGEKNKEEKESPKKEDEEEDDEEDQYEWGETALEKRRRIRAKDDKERSEWAALFKDTDAPPPRDHIAFRPVDDRWMRAKCTSLGFECSWELLETRSMAKVRAQSNICKVTDAPGPKSIVHIDGDGNCLFRALAWWVAGNPDQHAVVRNKIVNFMFKFPDEFGQRMTGKEGQKYTRESNNRMLNEGEWGTQCEIYGAATLLGVDIYTFHEGRWKSYRPLFEFSSVGRFKLTRKTEVNERTRFGLYLANDDNMHYDVVKYMEPVAPVTDTCYRLLATIMHRGNTTESGHYVADVYDQASGSWVHCDDRHTKIRSVIEVLADAMDHGYVLVYGKNSSVLKKKGVKCE